MKAFKHFIFRILKFYMHLTWADHERTKLIYTFNTLLFSGERFHDVAFEVSSDAIKFEQKGYFKGPGITNQVIEILFDFPTVGRYVRIRITQGTNNILNIVEIKIYCLDWGNMSYQYFELHLPYNPIWDSVIPLMLCEVSFILLIV